MELASRLTRINRCAMLFFASRNLMIRLFPYLYVQKYPLPIGLLWGNPVHHHPASVRKVGAGEEIALAPAAPAVGSFSRPSSSTQTVTPSPATSLS